MKIVRDIAGLKDIPVSFTLGSYDGLHTGHVLLLNELKKVSEQSGTASLVISFYPHPRKIVDENFDLKLLNTKDEKIGIISSLGIDLIHFINFTKEFSETGYIEFYTNYIFAYLDVKNIVAGTNHHFGENREGDNTGLSALCGRNSVNLFSVPPIEYEGRTVSSTRIRRSLADGDVENASKMLGYDYFISGNIVRGKGLGSVIGFPTANLNIEGLEKVIPASGVYLTLVKIRDEEHYAVTNIGNNPTVGGIGTNIESHLLDINSDIYGETVRISFLKRMRNEIKFSSERELSEALKKDVALAEKIIRSGGDGK
ncbi:MAG TPA: bifunctional riboflavin kinase/FAD synthetase [Clostridiales bacterium]|nr:bifunctional riboflavin kinase/FAD synthetase [Clostridiales bacterium]